MSCKLVIEPKNNPDNDQVVHGLAKRRSELQGLVNHLDNEMSKTKADIAHIDAVLSMWGIESPALKIRAKASGTAGLFHRGELPRSCMKMIRQSENGLTSYQMARQISLDKGWDVNDKRFQVALVDKVTKLMDKVRRQGRLSSEQSGNGVVWHVFS